MVDLAENSIVEDNDTTQLHTMENGASTSPYARANLQLPPKRKQSWREWIEGKLQGRSAPVSSGGIRIIHINNPIENDEQRFLHNSVTTGKYNLITFLPKFLYEEFSKYANIFFLFISCIQVKQHITLSLALFSFIDIFL